MRTDAGSGRSGLSAQRMSWRVSEKSLRYQMRPDDQPEVAVMYAVAALRVADRAAKPPVGFRAGWLPATAPTKPPPSPPRNTPPAQDSISRLPASGAEIGDAEHQHEAVTSAAPRGQCAGPHHRVESPCRTSAQALDEAQHHQGLNVGCQRTANAATPNSTIRSTAELRPTMSDSGINQLPQPVKNAIRLA
jgi:hypothetical protein